MKLFETSILLAPTCSRERKWHDVFNTEFNEAATKVTEVLKELGIH